MSSPPGAWVEVPKRLMEVLTLALDIGRASGGAFDIGMGDAVAAWGFGPAAADQHLIRNALDAPRRPAHAMLELDSTSARVRKAALITLDLNPLAPELGGKVRQQFVGSVLDAQLLDRVLAEYEVDRVFHLAALLSTRSEFSPALAHKVNVEGALNMLEFAQKQGESHGRPVDSPTIIGGSCTIGPSAVSGTAAGAAGARTASRTTTRLRWQRDRTRHRAFI